MLEFGMDSLRTDTKERMVLDHPYTLEEEGNTAGIRAEIGSSETHRDAVVNQSGGENRNHSNGQCHSDQKLSRQSHRDRKKTRHGAKPDAAGETENQSDSDDTGR